MPRRHQLKTPVQQEHDAGLLGHVNMCPLGILILTLNAANNTVKQKKTGKTTTMCSSSFAEYILESIFTRLPQTGRQLYL